MFGRTDPRSGELREAPLELVRLAVPRRVYTASHLEYVALVLGRIRERSREIKGLRMTNDPRVLRHFSASFEEVEEPIAVAC